MDFSDLSSRGAAKVSCDLWWRGVTGGAFEEGRFGVDLVGISMGFRGDLVGIYPLVMSNIAIENGHL